MQRHAGPALSTEAFYEPSPDGLVGPSSGAHVVKCRVLDEERVGHVAVHTRMHQVVQYAQSTPPLSPHFEGARKFQFSDKSRQTRTRIICSHGMGCA